MKEVPSAAAPFLIEGITFTCFAVTEPDGAQRYEWRTSDGGCIAGRNVGNGMHWARYGAKHLGEYYSTLRAAMRGAVEARRRDWRFRDKAVDRRQLEVKR